MKRKIDRRTLYTLSVIKDAFLELLKNTSFSKINVTAVCKQADITRATFYLHYQDIYAVLDEVLDEALQISESTGTVEQMISMIQQAGQEPDTETYLKENYAFLPVCQRLADNPKYRPLFTDRSLTSYILHHIVAREKTAIVPLLQQQFHLEESLAENLYLFLVSGAFAINQHHRWKKDEAWFQIQSMLLRFLQPGFQKFSGQGTSGFLHPQA